MLKMQYDYKKVENYVRMAEQDRVRKKEMKNKPTRASKWGEVEEEEHHNVKTASSGILPKPDPLLTNNNNKVQNTNPKIGMPPRTQKLTAPQGYFSEKGWQDTLGLF